VITKHNVLQQGNFVNIRRFILVVFLIMPMLLFTACDNSTAPATTTDTAVTPDTPALPTLAPTAIPPTPIPPTPTPTEPMAALVNGQPIFLAAYERELARYEQAQVELGSTPGADGTNYRSLVLDVLIEQALIAQAAAAQGVTIAPDAVDAKLSELESAAGDAGNFEAWLAANQWTREEFHTALASEMLTEAMVTAVTADVPTAVEQVNARYLQVDDLALAESLLQEIRAGADFAVLARQHSLDRITAENGGELDYFARGSLLIAPVEEAAFALEPGAVSDVITATNEDGMPTYYLVQVIDRNEERPLSADMRYTMLQQTFESWLDGLWQNADITRFIDT
jgi:parvulin-like peptidyl-prolyl isomerase